MAVKAPALATYHVLTRSFERSLLAENKSPHTIRAYTSALRYFGDYLVEHRMPTAIEAISREHVEEYLAGTLRIKKANTVANRHKALKLFFDWLVREGEICESPMRNVKAPRIPEEPPEVLAEDTLRRLLKVCEGQGFDQRRDMAIIRLLLDSGMRRAELAGLKVEDIDLDHNVALVMGKGRRPRGVPFGRKTALAVDRYFRERTRHRHADRPELWLGRRGPLTDCEVYEIVRKRTQQAGIGHIHPHLFRHTFAHS